MECLIVKFSVVVVWFCIEIFLCECLSSCCPVKISVVVLFSGLEYKFIGSTELDGEQSKKMRKEKWFDVEKEE